MGILTIFIYVFISVDFIFKIKFLLEHLIFTNKVKKIVSISSFIFKKIKKKPIKAFIFCLICDRAVHSILTTDRDGK